MQTEKEHLEQINLPGGAADAAHEGVQTAGKLLIFEKMKREHSDSDIIKAGVNIGIEPVGRQRPVEAEKFKRSDIAQASKRAETDEPETHAAAVEIEIQAKGGDEKIANEQQAIEIARNIDGTDEPFIGHVDDKRGE